MAIRKKRIGTFRIYILRGISKTGNTLGYYIGYTGCTLEQRVKDHFHEATTSKKNTKKLNWLRDSITCFTSEIIEDDILTEQEALKKEVMFIRYYKHCRPELGICKNGDDGGLGGTKNYSEEVIEKLRQSKIGNNWNTGKHLSENHRYAISKGNEGKIVSDSTRQLQSKNRKKRFSDLRESGIFHTAKNRKFSEQQVFEIFRLFNIEYKSPRQIGNIFNCSDRTIGSVLYGKQTYPDYKLKHNLKVEPAPFGRGAKYKMI